MRPPRQSQGGRPVSPRFGKSNPRRGGVTIGAGETKTFTVNVDASLGQPGVWQGALVLDTGAGRAPSVNVPVKVVISAYQVGVNAGGNALDASDLFKWKADRAHVDGGWGYIGSSKAETTNKATNPNDAACVIDGS